MYIRPAVERFTWEDEIAGVKMGEADGVPVLWRGCGPRCLDWLDEEDDEEEGADGGGGKTDDSDVQADVMATGEGDMDEAEFQPVDLSGGLAEAFYESDG